MWAIVQSQNTFQGSSNVSQSYTLANTSTGNTLIAIFRTTSSSITVTGVTISPGSAVFTKVINVADPTNNRDLEIWVAPNIVGGTTPVLTVNLSAAGGCEATIYEASGGDPTGATDGTNSNVSLVSSTTATSGSITTTVNGDLVVKDIRGGVPNGTPQAGWTEYNPSASNTAVGYIIQGSAGAISGTVTFTASAAASEGIIAAFKPAAVSGTQNISATGIASITAFGTAVFGVGVVNISPAGIASINAFGNPTLLGLANITPTGIVSTNIFGSPSVSAGATISPAGIASTNAFGATNVVRAPGSQTPTLVNLVPQTGMPSIYSSKSRELIYDALQNDIKFVLNPFGPQRLVLSRPNHRWN